MTQRSWLEQTQFAASVMDEAAHLKSANATLLETLAKRDAELAAARAENAKLRAELSKRERHALYCPATRDYCETGNVHMDECDCGIRDALADLAVSQ